MITKPIEHDVFATLLLARDPILLIGLDADEIADIRRAFRLKIKYLDLDRASDLELFAFVNDMIERWDGLVSVMSASTWKVAKRLPSALRNKCIMIGDTPSYTLEEIFPQEERSQ
jgi:hypothetical protein